ncbi:LysR family transcriptional regulator [Oricola thermophila]|uniref:LysR family transcriptional regulator n=1 Tax=Oricola thermophila TaxID=2742145 RepID=A0A6N1VDZ1_9HYPH|nr:LysR family transcriptional regulator [Oricola thermophila]QKV17257.1 LysR family transcriptional regulator [Oricola thermophila]
MNIEHARTFLAVADTGSFVAAAERLHVTQSTVSARISALEKTLGAQLFVRNRSGAVLTNSGGRFLKHAGQLVRTMERARQDIGLPKKFRSRVVIGGRMGLWDGVMVDWFASLSTEYPSVSFRAEIGFEPDLMQGLVEGRIDIGVMYTPQRRPNLVMRPLLDERLVMVTSEADRSLRPEAYVHVDWGAEFDNQFNASFPEFPGPAVTVNIGWLGLQLLARNGGCGYFPRRLVEAQLSDRSLFVVPGTPEFELPAWVVVREDRNASLVDPMVESLTRAVA